MPALFCLALHPVLEAGNAQLQEGEMIVAYLDDVYIVSNKERAREVYNIVTGHIRDLAGIEVNLRKTECRGKGGGDAPPGIDSLAPPDAPSAIWKGNLEEEANGIEVLGSPLGSLAFIEAHSRERLGREHKLLNKLNNKLKLQTAWLLL